MDSTPKTMKKCCAKAAGRDIATGLPNEYGFAEKLAPIIRDRRIIDYDGLFIDIAKMSLINSRFGKAAGDEVIQSFATILEASIDPDEVVARRCGDNFVALTRKRNRERILELLKEPVTVIHYDGECLPLRISTVIGVYEIQTNDITADAIVAHAVTAYSYAKNVVHKTCTIMNPELEEILRNNQKLEAEIQLGLERKEFLPFYQPKIDTKQNRIIGAEALARWYHDGKYVSPAVFIPGMECTHMISELDFYMLDCVCADLHDWIARGITPVEISVNFSKVHLSEPELADRIHGVLEQYNIPARLIQIELTETLTEMSSSHIGELLDQLHGYGISSAIDDFGSGSSSISLLKHADFDCLKVDKSFVDYSSAREKKLLKHIIQMGKDMGMDVIAEGVEKEEQIRELNLMGCYKMQGFYWDKPMDKTSFEEKRLKG